MGTRGLEIICFHGRYYIIYHQYDSYYEGLGAALVKRIPEDPEEYAKWLESMRAKYAAEEQALEDEVYTIRPVAEAEQTEGSRRVKAPRRSLYRKYVTAPTVLPQLDTYDAENFYIINLDAEVLTMNFSVHWRMDRIPRADDMWLKSLSDSVYRYTHTVDLDLCPESCLASLAVPLPARDTAGPMQVEGTRKLSICAARTQLDSHDKVWRALVASGVWSSYGRQIGRFGRQWYPQDLPFRELLFALVSLSTGRHTAFRSYCPSRLPRSSPTEPDGGTNCHPRNCQMPFCFANHLRDTPGWLGQEWFVGGNERKTQSPLLEFCSPAHWEDQPPGAAPLETTYWLTDDVLISLTLTVDGAAVTKAMEWGLEQRRAKNKASDDSDDGRHRPAVHFYMVVLSLFNVVFAEVSQPTSVVGGPGKDKSKPTAKETENRNENGNGNENGSMPDILVSSVLPLSPLDETLCLSTHPRERPVRGSGGEGAKRYILPHECMDRDPYQDSLSDIQKDYPGIAAMVNFLAAIDSRRAASVGATQAGGCLPPELYAHILEIVDYDTWKNCLLVSPLFRALGLSRYRLDNRYAIVGGPGTMPHIPRGEPLMTFELRDLSVGKTETIIRERSDGFLTDYGWVPLLGSGHRQAVILDVYLMFRSVEKAKQRQKKWEDRRASYKREQEEKAATRAAAAATGAPGST